MRVLRRLNIHIRVAHVYTFRWGYAKFTDNREYGIRAGLLADTKLLPFSGNGMDHGKIPMDQSNRRVVEFVGDHGKVITVRMQLFEHGGDPIVGLGVRGGNSGVLCAEPCKAFVELGIGVTIGYGAFHQLFHTIADCHAHGIDGLLRHMIRPQRNVYAVVEIVQGVQQCAIQIKYNRCVFFHIRVPFCKADFSATIIPHLREKSKSEFVIFACEKKRFSQNVKIRAEYVAF